MEGHIPMYRRVGKIEGILGQGGDGWDEPATLRAILEPSKEEHLFLGLLF